MLMKKHYEKDAEGNILKISAIEVKHTGVNPEQHFSTRLIEELMRAGFATMGRDKLRLETTPMPLVYTVKRWPGYYCCHCGDHLPDGGLMLDATSETVGQQHVGICHPGAKCPDLNNPAGYERINYLDCVLEADLHEEFKLKKEA